MTKWRIKSIKIIEVDFSKTFPSLEVAIIDYINLELMLIKYITVMNINSYQPLQISLGGSKETDKISVLSLHLCKSLS